LSESQFVKRKGVRTAAAAVIAHSYQVCHKYSLSGMPFRVKRGLGNKSLLSPSADPGT
jgi:hypothetical protein